MSAMPRHIDQARQLLEQVAWFQALPEVAREALLAGCEGRDLPGGAVLFFEGETSDSAYLVLSGSLGAFKRDEHGSHLIGQIVMGETVGELGVLTQRPRTASVRALRDSEVLRLPAAHLEAVGAQYPQALVGLSRLALRRATEPRASRYHDAAPRTIALLAQSEGVDLRGFAQTLAVALSRYGKVRQLTSDSAGLAPAQYLAMESEARFVLYIADAADAEWRSQCRRQADAWLLVARASGQPTADAEILFARTSASVPTPEHLVLVHDGKPRLGAGHRWHALRDSASLHHVRHAGDIGRVARLLCGQSLGLVLSGGGARGFAHIGVIKALREAGFEIDVVGGTSIGAVIGAGIAADWSVEEMTEIFRRCFYDTNPLSDYTLPFVSLVSGRKASRLLQEAFGSRDIEDLPLPYFCMSSNLTTGKAAIHRRGPLWQWLRASIAIPGLMPPVCMGGEVHVDGGVINNLPVDVMRGMHQGEVIAVDIGGNYVIKSAIDEVDLPPIWQLATEWFRNRRRPKLSQILLRAGMVNSGSAALEARELSTLLLTPPLDDIDLLEWKAFYRAIDRGYQHTLRIVGGRKDVLSEAPGFL
ncbi:MAG: patatin-like phospholipase family protein [Pseudomonadota bacterium]|nr:patatin-like phospholipase family protein [Pseudomonadota bacterium]